MTRKKHPTTLEISGTPGQVMTARMDHANEALESWKKESDRGAGLVVFSYMDIVLGDLLRKKMIVERSKELDQTIMDYPGPLSATSVGIDMAYALGCIGPNTHHDLKLMKEIRNRFAHSRTHIGFNETEITAWCDSLHFGKYPGRPGVIFSAKDQFLLAGCMILIQLWQWIDNSTPPDKGVDQWPSRFTPDGRQID